MQKTFNLADYTVRYKMLGRQTGGFNERYVSKEIASKNLAMLGASFKGQSATLMLPQMGAGIKEVGPDIKDVACDVLVTAKPFHALMMRPADCIPMVIFSDSQPLLALVHGSRKGLDQGIVEKTINYLSKYNASPHDLHVYIGPSIKGESYVLPADIADKLAHPSWRNFVKRKSDYIYLDTVGFSRFELIRLGVLPQNISVSNINTASHPGYYSNYRATRYGDVQGRNGVVAVMNK